VTSQTSCPIALNCGHAQQSLTAGPAIREHYLRDASDTPDEQQWITEIA
jgi:hypothetical protein